jgi:putative Mg2+ transporter-C (MgtC) family protein
MGEKMQTNLPLVDVVTRLGLATLVGMIIGLEREWRQKPAGLRTHMLVSLASAAFTIITFELFQASLEMAPDSKGDPVRVIEGVIAGVAFLGAGTIIQGRGEVKGLTTGASIWLAGATGLACGGGYYVIAGITVGLAVVILAVLGLLERKEDNPWPSSVLGGLSLKVAAVLEPKEKFGGQTFWATFGRSRRASGWGALSPAVTTGEAARSGRVSPDSSRANSCRARETRLLIVPTAQWQTSAASS